MIDEIKDAEVEEIKREETPMEREKRTKRDFYIELVLFLILGVLIGIAVKTEANKRITIGFNDYKMKIGAAHYSVNQLQAELLNKQVSRPNATDENQESSEGATCTNNQ